MQQAGSPPTRVFKIPKLTSTRHGPSRVLTVLLFAAASFLIQPRLVVSREGKDAARPRLCVEPFTEALSVSPSLSIRTRRLENFSVAKYRKIQSFTDIGVRSHE
jgi:hypothetical protein